MPLPLLTGFPTTGLRAFDFSVVVPGYAGPVAKITISGVDTDVDHATLLTQLAGGAKTLKRVYAQDGSGDYLVPASGTPVAKLSTLNNLPCIYGGVMGLSTYNGWNGKTHVNIVLACRPISATAGHLMDGGSDLHGLYGGGSAFYLYENSLSAYNKFTDAFERLGTGMVLRYKFDGSQAAADRLSLYTTVQTKTASIEGTDPGATFTNETGVYFGGTSGGLSLKDIEFFGIYVFTYDIDSQWASLLSGIKTAFFPTTDSEVDTYGDSLTVSYNLNSGDPTNTYPEQLERQLEIATGTNWNIRNPEFSIAEIGATFARVYQLAEANGPKNIDDMQRHRIAVAWAGTNTNAASTVAAKTFTADATTNALTSAAHGYASTSRGFNARFSNSGGALPGGLVAGIDYFIEYVDANTLKVATTFLNLVNLVYVDITDAGTGTHTITPTPAPAKLIEAAGALAQRLLDYGHSKVFFLNMLPRQDLGSGNAAFETARLSFNAGLAAGMPAGVRVIDVASQTHLQDPTNGAYFNSDDVHLVLTGYTIVAQTVASAIEAYMLVVISTSSLADGQLGTSTPQTITAVGGLGAKTFAISAGSFTSGRSLDPITGQITGTYTELGTFNFSISAQDEAGDVTTQAYTQVVTQLSKATIAPLKVDDYRGDETPSYALLPAEKDFVAADGTYIPKGTDFGQRFELSIDGNGEITVALGDAFMTTNSITDAGVKYKGLYLMSSDDDVIHKCFRDTGIKIPNTSATTTWADLVTYTIAHP